MTGELTSMTLNELLSRFATIALEQDDADIICDTETYSRLFYQLQAIEDELHARNEIESLAGLLTHPNVNVRYMTAEKLMKVARMQAEARPILERIRQSGRLPQSMRAGMSIISYDSGESKPRY